jgi:AcrR family transcriptional regulator
MAKANALDRVGSAADSGTRRTEILQTAASLIATSGLRTSLQEIADAAGILPGSLYHHFESKEAILVELMQRYQDDLNRIGLEAQARLDEPDGRPAAEKITELGTAIANCAVEHQAALQMSFYEGPNADPELLKRAQQASPIHAAMLQTLRAGRWSGYIMPDIDLPILADRICQTMLQVGLDVIRDKASADQVADLMCRIILHGLVARPPADTALDKALDGSRAFAAASEVIEAWAEDRVADPGDKAARLRAVARTEFGRKGYEVTTIRDIASAAGLGTGTVYRVIGSKDELLDSIMRSFGQKVEAGWVAVLRSDATPVEKLDAMSWVNVNALDQFSDEFRIQLAWMRQSPPTTNPGWSYATRLRQMKSLLSEGIRSGEIRIDTPSTAMLARCVIGMQWVPENILREIGLRASLLHARDTVLRGVAVPGK